MSTQCPNCRAKVSSTAKFCQDCGTSLQDNSADRITGVQRRPAFVIDQPEVPKSIRKKMEAAHENLSGARRLVTVMFADVQGFTSLCEKLDAEQVTDLMNRYLGRLGEVVYEFEGYVDKFMGDCIMALFGAPIAHENDPELAVRAALKMLAELEKLNYEHRLQLGIRIGVNSGMVVAGGVGTNRKFDFTVMGDAVNIAQRLQTVADPNTIVVGRSVAKACQSIFEFKALEQKKLKGKTELVEAFQVAGFRKRAVAAQGVRDANLKLIGREDEIQFFAKTVELFRDRTAKPFVLSAPAGMGKSRLKLEFKNRVERSKIRWFEARGNPLKTESTYALMKMVVQQLLSEFIKVDPVKKRPILEPLEDLGLDEVHHLFLELLLDLVDPQATRPNLEPQQLKRSTFLALRALFEESSKREPFILFIDDLQSVDMGSIEMLEYLADVSPSALITGAIRSDERSMSPKFEAVTLHPLAADQMIDLAKSLLKSDQLPQSVAQILMTKSQGIPLYVEELLKGLMESGQLIRRNEAWEFIKSDRDIALPDSIQSLILARIDRMYPSDRKVLEYCAILGRQFSDRLLRQIVGSQAPLQESLQFLRRRELIFEIGVNEIETEYIFNHPLTQEVVYNSILVKNRKEMHREVAEVFESSLNGQKEEIDENLLQSLAYHFALAEDETKGFDYLLKAIARRCARYQFESALALVYWGEKYFGSKQARLTEVLSETLDELGQFERSQKSWSRLLEIGDLRMRAIAHRRLSDIYRRQNQMDLARSSLTSGEELRMSLSSQEVDFDYEKSWANLLRSEGKPSEALTHLEKNLTLAGALGDSLKLAETLNDLGATFLSLQDLKAAESAFLKSFQLAKEIREPSIFIRAVMNLGSIFFIRQELADATKYFDRAVKMSEAISDPWNRLLALHNLGLSYSKSQNFVDAERCFKTALHLSNLLSMPKHRSANEKALQELEAAVKSSQYSKSK